MMYIYHHSGDFPEELNLAKVISICKAYNEHHNLNLQTYFSIAFLLKLFEKVISLISF